ncbi:MAG: DoxX protein [Rikenellaceae bacterium]|nr:DoxX protein [Rikenellaceae bacterium]
MMSSRKRPVVINLLRIIFAAVFIFSGFVKAVDPWGTAIKLGEYFSVFGMEWLSGARMFLSIFLSSVELLLGLLLLFNIRVKTVSFFVSAFMLIFTVITLISAVTDPVSDCGCFGEAVKLTNWQTFYKNIVLLPLSVIMFLSLVRENKKRKCNTDIIFVVLLAGISVYPAIDSYRHLPKIDFLPFKTGTNIRQGMAIPEGASAGDYKTLLTYRNIETDQLHDFTLEDTTWYDNTVWEFVDSRSEEIEKGYTPEIGDFSVFSGSRNITADILNDQGEVYLFVFQNPLDIKKTDAERIKKTIDFALRSSDRMIYVTSSSVNNAVLARYGIDIEGYNMDATTIKMLLRAHDGLVVLNKGTILAKWNIRDIPDFGNSVSAAAFIIQEKRLNTQINFIVYLSLSVLLLLILYYRSCRRN